MTRNGWLIVPALIVALLIGGAIGAAVVDHDDDRGGRVVQVTPAEPGQQPQVITIDDDNHWRGGFVPFGFIFPLLWIGLIVFFVSMFWRRGSGGGPWGGDRWDSKFEEWHQRQHQSDGPPPTPPSAASA